MIYALLDRLAERYGEGEHKLEAMRAREEYFDRAGKVFDDDAELFEGRMSSFLEWYVLERPLGGGGLPPVGRAIEESTRSALAAEPPAEVPPAVPSALPSHVPSDVRRFTATADELSLLATLAVSHRSLFELTAEAGRELELEDVLGGARFTVQERRSTVGISPGDLFEARLIWDGRAVVFGRTFLFHPPDARQVVLDWVERAVAQGMSRPDILFHLSRQYVRWHRLGHVGAAKVYRDA